LLPVPHSSVVLALHSRTSFWLLGTAIRAPLFKNATDLRTEFVGADFPVTVFVEFA
jgi:hypothetical protein